MDLTDKLNLVSQFRRHKIWIQLYLQVKLGVTLPPPHHKVVNQVLFRLGSKSLQGAKNVQAMTSRWVIPHLSPFSPIFFSVLIISRLLMLYYHT